MAASAGYSATPLPRKLGLKDGQCAGFVALPDPLTWLAQSASFSRVDCVEAWPALRAAGYDVLHVFSKSAQVIAEAIVGLRPRMASDGMLWMSWPKRASKVPTDVTEDVIRDLALANRLVDVKVCAIDDIWSGLKLVIRKQDRARHERERISG